MDHEERPVRKRAGIRLSRLNVLLICVGLVFIALMVFSMSQTTSNVKEIVGLTNNYLSNMQTGGMLRDVAQRLGEQAAAFVQTGEPGYARAYEGQMDTIKAQLDLYTPESSNSKEANEEFMKALGAYQERQAVELRAMRLVADNMPGPAFDALPAFLQETELSAEDQALSPEEKKETAAALLADSEYTANIGLIRDAVDSTHRLSSEAGKIQANNTFTRVKKIVSEQTVLILLILGLAVLALALNSLLIISPIKRSVGNLDRREPIPEQGSYEMRHMAKVYNDVLKDNEEKTKALSYTASHDALTGVYNRDAFDKMYRDIEKREHYGIIVADVDHFKQYNDDFGHDIGDRVLCAAVEALKRNFRSVDHISRIGGDEFCIIMPRTDYDQGNRIRDKIIRINQELAGNSDELPPISISAGIAFWDRPDPKGSLFKDADSSLMSLKKNRDQCCAVYPEGNAPE